MTPVKIKNVKLGHYVPKGKKEFVSEFFVWDLKHLNVVFQPFPLVVVIHERWFGSLLLYMYMYVYFICGKVVVQIIMVQCMHDVSSKKVVSKPVQLCMWMIINHVHLKLNVFPLTYV